jgi:hypothetical protein
MIGFEVVLNGTRICTAAAGDDGVLTAIVTSVGKRHELELKIGGLIEDAHLNWPVPRNLAVGDEIRTCSADRPPCPPRQDPAGRRRASRRGGAEVLRAAQAKVREQVNGLRRRLEQAQNNK